jgi:hypothetical protein
MKTITKTIIATTTAAACVGVVLAGAPAQADRHHGHRAQSALVQTSTLSNADVQVQLRLNTTTVLGNDFCITAERHRIVGVTAFSPFTLAAVTQGACGTQTFPVS